MVACTNMLRQGGGGRLAGQSPEQHKGGFPAHLPRHPPSPRAAPCLRGQLTKLWPEKARGPAGGLRAGRTDGRRGNTQQESSAQGLEERPAFQGGRPVDGRLPRTADSPNLPGPEASTSHRNLQLHPSDSAPNSWQPQIPAQKGGPQPSARQERPASPQSTTDSYTPGEVIREHVSPDTQGLQHARARLQQHRRVFSAALR